jgi:hypothetical protein
VTGDGFLAGAVGGAGGASRVDARALILDQRFDSDTLHALRGAVRDHAVQIGLPEDLAGDLVLAVHELAANAVAHGAGHGRLGLWHLPGALTCEIVDDGPPNQSRHPEPGGPSLGGPSLRDPSLGGPSESGEPSGGSGPGGTCYSGTCAVSWPVVEGHGLWLARQVAARLDLWSDYRGTRAVITFRLPGDH